MNEDLRDIIEAIIEVLRDLSRKTENTYLLPTLRGIEFKLSRVQEEKKND